MVISKSEFMLFLKHPAWLWLKKFDKDKLPLPDEELQVRFDEGALFESYAEKIFPNATRLGYKKDGVFSGTMYYSLPQLTLQEIKNGAQVILQGRLEVEDITSIFDVLERVDSKTFDLYEIKSSTSVKPEHIQDLAFQTLVLEKSGFTVRSVYVLHVNNKYVRNGEIDPEGISAKADVTEDVREAIPEVLENIEKAFKVLSQKEMPSLSPRYLKPGYDIMKEWLQILQLVKGEFPKYSIYKLAGADPETLEWLEDNGIEAIKDIPLDAPLSEKQFRQLEAVKSGKQAIDKEEINNFLSSLEYPLHFFDYETVAGVLPAFDGYRPYQQIPFQYSLHILPRAGEELVLREYLHTEKSDPVPELLKHMAEHFDPKGSIVSWSMKFEKARNNEMALAHPEYANLLNDINERMVDLMEPFSKGWFVDKDFFGSASIKRVLPVLLPELSYKELEISGGGQAQRVWMQTVLEGKDKEKKDEIMNNLRKYCNLDTYAMYAIFEYLRSKI